MHGAKVLSILEPYRAAQAAWRRSRASCGAKASSDVKENSNKKASHEERLTPRDLVPVEVVAFNSLKVGAFTMPSTYSTQNAQTNASYLARLPHAAEQSISAAQLEMQQC